LRQNPAHEDGIGQRFGDPFPHLTPASFHPAALPVDENLFAFDAPSLRPALTGKGRI